MKIDRLTLQFVLLALVAAPASLAWGESAPVPTGSSAPESATTRPSAAPEDFDAERADLERQRSEIERKLQELSGRRRAAGATAPASAPAPALAPPAGASSPIAPPPIAPTTAAAAAPAVDQFSLHGQSTVVTQAHDVFPAPYTGPHSVPAHEPDRTSVTGTLFLGARLPWEGGEIYFDPEIAGGDGIGGVTGIAGFPNGEIPRVASPEPEPYVARLYLQQTFGLGGDRERVESDQNRIAGYRDVDRLTVTVGKFSAADFFDANAYSHDPRTQFLNWALMDTGSWDYPADTRGYTYGLVLELNEPTWTLRYGALGEPRIANGGEIDSRINAEGNVLELEERYQIAARPGTARIMAYENNAHMGNYAEALAHPGPSGPDVTLTRTYSVKYGFGFSVDQSLSDDMGLFARGGWNDGHTETWAYTEIDRTVALGLSVKGSRWLRPDDTVGLALAVNGLSKDHRDYLAAGGLGFELGDGRLHYALEEDIEAYYSLKLSPNVTLSPDFQLIDHPGYNSDRGPIVIGGLRAHIEF